jgi:hypothetical protein
MPTHIWITIKYGRHELFLIFKEIVEHELLSFFSQNLKIMASITHCAISVGLLCEWISQYKDFFSQNLKITASITHCAISVGLLCEWISQYKDGHVGVKPTEWPGRIIRIKRETTVFVSKATFLYSLSKWLSSIRSYFNGVIYLIFILIQNLLRDYRAYKCSNWRPFEINVGRQLHELFSPIGKTSQSEHLLDKPMMTLIYSSRQKKGHTCIFLCGFFNLHLHTPTYEIKNKLTNNIKRHLLASSL